MQNPGAPAGPPLQFVVTGLFSLSGRPGLPFSVFVFAAGVWPVLGSSLWAAGAIRVSGFPSFKPGCRTSFGSVGLSI
jgi:hypothetical protein